MTPDSLLLGLAVGVVALAVSRLFWVLRNLPEEIEASLADPLPADMVAPALPIPSFVPFTVASAPLRVPQTGDWQKECRECAPGRQEIATDRRSANVRDRA